MTAVLDATTTEDLADVYAAHAPRLLRLATSMIGSRAIAEELVHDVFIRAYERWDTVDAPGAYLRTSVVNACRSWHRRNAVERAKLARRGCVTVSQLDARELVDAVDALPPAQRAAVRLRFYDDCSERDIARTLGCSTGTVKSNIARGIKNLRRAVEL